MKSLLNTLLLSLTITGLMGCSIGTVPMTKEQRVGDMNWVFATFDTNYAPLEYKTTKHTLNVDQIKAECTSRAEKDQTNDDFRALVYECVSKFKDAHTSASAMGNIQPGKANVSYLGFKTSRAKTIDGKLALRVTSFLASVQGAEMPLRVGNLITEINGEPVETVLRRDVMLYRDLGQDESSLTIAAANFATRSGLSTKLPTATEVKLTVQGKDKTVTLTLPWIKKDVYDFMKEQAAAKSAPKGEKNKAEEKNQAYIKSLSAKFGWKMPQSTSEKLAAKLANPNLEFPRFWNQFLGYLLLEKIDSDKNDQDGLLISNLLNYGFGFADLDPALEALNFAAAEQTDKFNRIVPEGAVKIDSENFLAYIVHREDANKQDVAVGYIHIPSFGVEDEDVIAYMGILDTFNKQKVTRVVLDLLDNGGGSLVHGMRMVNLLRPEGVEFPNMQVRLNTSWLDSFKGTELNGPTDAHRELARRMGVVLRTDLAKGQRLSSPFSIKELDPYVDYIKDRKALNKGTKVVLLVNEMCASMCDIFAAVYKDNKVGVVAGSKTMGAGGNVVQHMAAPTSGITLRQTESLMLRKDGSYIENNGIEPDVALDLTGGRETKYINVVEKALDPEFAK